MYLSSGGFSCYIVWLHLLGPCLLLSLPVLTDVSCSNNYTLGVFGPSVLSVLPYIQFFYKL